MEEQKIEEEPIKPVEDLKESKNKKYLNNTNLN